MNSINKCENLLKAHVYSLKSAQIMQALGIDQAAVSRIKSGERGIRFDELPKLLRLSSPHCPHGIALYNATHVAFSKPVAKALMYLSFSLLESSLNELQKEEDAS